MKNCFCSLKRPVLAFILVKILSLLVSYLAIFLIPDFGNSFPYADRVLTVTGLPEWIWGWGGFDGVHYLRIAQNGYQDLYYQAFFPLFPLLIRIFNFFPRLGLDPQLYVDPSFFYTGILLSNLFLFLALVVTTKIIKEKDYFWSVLFLLSFPTAFYLGAVYTESLFLLELLLFVLFLKKKKYLISGIIVAVASATRLVGIFLFPVLLIKVIKDIRDGKIKTGTVSFGRSIFSILVAPLGLLSYMFYLKRTFGNYFSFVSVQAGFGAERSGLPVISLPQVFYRYLKMFLTAGNNYQLFNLSLEFTFAVFGLVLVVWLFRKVDFGWWLFLFFSYLTPTLTGTFSSLPRYLLFPYIFLIPSLVKLNTTTKIITVGLMILLQIILLSLFTRGYWVA